MSTTAQIKANRQNSQKSTGPRSAEGKAAVSKNAIKHGLFASEAVIKGESAEEFETFRDEMLNELAPVGPVESMLAERYVSLSWRLKRIERMQNQAIDVMIERDEQPSPLAKLAQSMLPKHLRQFKADASEFNPELVLGRVAIKDYSNSRVLEKLMMYERRIENSMFKTLHELERLRLLRELEQANEAEEELTIPEAFGFEASTQTAETPDAPGVNFKKQTQSTPKVSPQINSGGQKPVAGRKFVRDSVSRGHGSTVFDPECSDRRELAEICPRFAL
jgi:hypothetical protein